MQLRKEIREEKEVFVFDLVCKEDGCTTKGGDIAFTARQVAVHGGQQALEAKLNAEYSHQCDTHKPQAV